VRCLGLRRGDRLLCRLARPSLAGETVVADVIMDLTAAGDVAVSAGAEFVYDGQKGRCGIFPRYSRSVTLMQVGH